MGDHRCPKCGGQLFIDRREDDPDVACLQCGYRPVAHPVGVKVTPEAHRAVDLAERKRVKKNYAGVPVPSDLPRRPERPAVDGLDRYEAFRAMVDHFRDHRDIVETYLDELGVVHTRYLFQMSPKMWEILKGEWGWKPKPKDREVI